MPMEEPLLPVGVAFAHPQEPVAVAAQEDFLAATVVSRHSSRTTAPSRRSAELRRRRTRFGFWYRSIRKIRDYVLTVGLTAAQTRAAHAVTPTAATIVRKLKATVLLTILCFEMSVFLHLVFAFEAVSIHADRFPINKNCAPLETWLLVVTFVLEREWEMCVPLGFVMYLCLQVRFVGVAYVVTLWFIFIGHMVLQAQYQECRRDAHAVWEVMGAARLINFSLLACQVILLPLLMHFAASLRSRVLSLAYRRGACQEVIRTLPVLSAADVSTSTECPVCLIGWADNSSWKQLPCRHLFHTTCIERWLRLSTLCPVCRAEVRLLQV
eukprot:TRINITY_DN6796_c0_g2_i1.p1 TRINITY_DN6796_c0_g2~~TRINITY_DN6796_c0_g2_i1.p1  ORF type:complete len:325 (-),score=23.21 TRINITY_DN6796_c0_g2_i1:23-997(-)